MYPIFNLCLGKRIMLLKNRLFYILKRIGVLPENVIEIPSLEYINVQSLDLGRGLEKQLDEYRALLNTIEKETGYFSSEQGEFSAIHAESLDNYLGYLYKLRFQKEPISSNALNYLRPQPTFIQLNR